MDAYLYPLTGREAQHRTARLREYVNTLRDERAARYAEFVGTAIAEQSATLPAPASCGLTRREANPIAVAVANIILAS